MTETVDPYEWSRRFDLLYDVQLSMLYHRKRERFYDRFDRLAKATAIIGGSIAFAKALGEALQYLGAAVALTSACSLVFSFSERARMHSKFAEDFGMIGAEIAAKGERDFTEDDLKSFDAKIRLLEAKEPASLGALVRMCQNELAVSHGQPEKLVHVSLLQRMFAHFWDFGPAPIRRTPVPAA